MEDYSFIRLKPTLQEALDTNPSAMSNLGYFNQVRLATDELYTQITNTTLGIAFDGNYAVTVCDCEGNLLETITNDVLINEFTDNKGIQQIAFTLDNIGIDFYEKPVLLKFVHTVSDYAWYSNLINITDENKYLTTRFDYRAYSDFYGTAYNIANKYQSIRLNCYFKGNDSESKGVEYTSIDGLKVTSRLIETELEKYRFEQLDNFTYRRLNKLLSHPVVYINDSRVTDKQTLKSTDFLGRSNFMNIDFNVSINYNEKYSDILLAQTIYKDFKIGDWDDMDFLTG
jgi:hypothetical protein